MVNTETRTASRTAVNLSCGELAGLIMHISEESPLKQCTLPESIGQRPVLPQALSARQTGEVAKMLKIYFAINGICL